MSVWCGLNNAKMNKIVFFILLSAGSYSPFIVNGRDSADTGLKIPDSTVYLNAIGFNISPLIISFLGGHTDLMKAGILYKNQIGSGKRLRMGFDRVTDNKQEYNYSRILSMNDSLMVREFTALNQSPRFVMRIGFEVVQGIGKVKSYVGCDIIAGRIRENYRLSAQEYRKDTATVVYGYETWVFSKQSGDYPQYKFTANARFVGISPFAGAEFRINARMFFTFQIGFDLFYLTGLYPYYNDKSNIALKEYSSLAGDHNALINDVSIHIRF